MKIVLFKLSVLIPKLRPTIAPSLHSPMDPSTVPNNEWRKRILDSRSGQSNANPFQTVNPLPVILQLYVTMSPGHVHSLLVLMSLPDPIRISIEMDVDMLNQLKFELAIL